MKKVLLILLFCVGVLFFSGRAAFAQDLSQPLVAESKYFSVYSDRSVDLYAVLKKLNFEYLVYEGSFSKNSDDVRSLFVKSLDGLYLAVSDVMDIHIYSYHGKLAIFPTRAALQSFLKQTYGLNLAERSYYFYDQNTIYISFADLTSGVLGHEMAHAIISRYFVVPPPPKVQEILCGYVEYSLRKTQVKTP